MFDPETYRLLDFGSGRKLERFGPHVLDRPSPAAAAFVAAQPARWAEADARYDRSDGGTGSWSPPAARDWRWTIRDGALAFELKPTEFGHLGVFPEHAANWQWVAARVRACSRPLNVLNLFAYTGGCTLAAAAAGAEVVHVDAARNTVAWARRNAAAAGLEDRPIRWIDEDAMKFVRRELKRGSGYDAVILDPPSYGHGPSGEPWQIDDDLPELLRLCGQLTAGRASFVLLSCHSPGLTEAELSVALADAMRGRGPARLDAQPMQIVAEDGRRLPCGYVARWSAADR